MKLFGWLRHIRHRKQREQELDEEIHAHLAMAIRERIEQREDPAEAEANARREFGNATLAKEVTRDMWGWRRLEILLQDLRYGLRQFRRSPGFSAVAVVTLALAIGATTSIFSVVYAVLLQPLPFRNAARLVLIKENVNRLSNLMNLPAPDVLTFARDSRAFEEVGGFQQSSMELSGIGEPEMIPGARLTAAVFPALGVSPIIGRTFTPEEDDRRHRVAVISYSLWRTCFSGNSRVLGRRVDLNRQPYLIIGVMPRNFEFPLVPGKLSQAQLWVPMSFTPKERADVADNWMYGAIARLKPGVSVAQAEQDANRIARQIQTEDDSGGGVDIQVTASLVGVREDAVRSARPLIRALFGAALAVLLIACANLAGLLFVRGIGKRREIAVRQALGASNFALCRQSLIESLFISIAGGLLGVYLAWAGLRAWVSLLPSSLPRIGPIGLNAPVALFALAVTGTIGILCGLAPALPVMHSSMNEGLKDGSRSVGPGSHPARLRAGLVVLEVAGALVLLTAAGLLLRSFERMRDVDPGFEPEHVVTASYSLPGSRYRTQRQVDSFHQSLLRRLRELPGVKSAALVSNLPIAEPNSDRFFVAEGYHAPRGAAYSDEAQAYVMGDYLQTMEIPLVRGRYLNNDDTANSPLVVVVCRTLAERYWPGQNPIGKRIKWGIDSGSSLPWMMVVGEVDDTKQGPLDSKNWNQVYQPLVQFPRSWGDAAERLGVHGQDMRIAVRTPASPKPIETSVRKAVWSLDPQLAVNHVQSMEQAISLSEAPRRFNTAVLTGFALGAVILAALGIYGVVAFSVASRTQEIAIRMALGARRSEIVQMVLAAGAKLAVLGSVLGLGGAAVATRLLRSLLFEVSPFDPAVFALAVACIIALALVSSLVPAYQAARVDPMVALRHE
ncbi:MAG TPA: ABC transporter permease [Terriglobia bacterium]|nr:ABC transporter permease [Terriglobia bacterium]